MNSKLFLCIGFFLQVSILSSSDNGELIINYDEKRIPVKVFWGRSPRTAIPIHGKKAELIVKFIKNKSIPLEGIINIEILTRKNKIFAAMNYSNGHVLFMEFQTMVETIA